MATMVAITVVRAGAVDSAAVAVVLVAAAPREVGDAVFKTVTATDQSGHQ